MKKKILELVYYALMSKSNAKKELQIGTVSKAQAKQLREIVDADFANAPRVIDNYMIRHAIAKHGSPSYESKRGQIAITTDDFVLIPTVFSNPDKIEFAGKNSIGQDLVKYTKKVGNTLVVIEAVRIAKAGNKMVFTTMYKKK